MFLLNGFEMLNAKQELEDLKIESRQLLPKKDGSILHIPSEIHMAMAIFSYLHKFHFVLPSEFIRSCFQLNFLQLFVFHATKPGYIKLGNKVNQQFGS